MCTSEKCNIKLNTEVRGVLATGDTFETLVDLVGLQQSPSISKTFNSWSLWLNSNRVGERPGLLDDRSSVRWGLGICLGLVFGWALGGQWLFCVSQDDVEEGWISVLQCSHADVCTPHLEQWQALRKAGFMENHAGSCQGGAEAASQLCRQLSSCFHTSL